MYSSATSRSCIDLLLKEIMNNAKPFGGKVIVIGGNFQHTLPAVHRGTHVDVIESCIKSSPLWPVFTCLSLTENMCSCGQNQHNKWLLNVGTGSFPQLETLSYDCVEIPQRMIEDDNLIYCIYGGNLIDMDMERLAK
ncbi:hypothetical protein AVEN_65878-1 [Araneus ventricosus]|uniref:ATP-dependent DNA helicase n=1 Tax=Araneus ventricosus TaxID=182803 RepID=A0A4Y2HE72_ARAVE|nr:hypothetical protein AVEN_65878-1 [Araneus ventricosus]